MSFQTRKTSSSSSEHKLRYFCLNLSALWPSHRQQGSLHDQGPEKYQDDRQSSPCDISLSTVILRRHKNTFCAKKTKIKILFHIFISSVSLVDVRSRQYLTQARGGASPDPDPAWWRWTHGVMTLNTRHVFNVITLDLDQGLRHYTLALFNFLICVLKMNGGLTGLERHEGE